MTRRSACGRPVASLAGQITGQRRRGESDAKTARIPALAAEIVVARQRVAEVITARPTKSSVPLATKSLGLQRLWRFWGHTEKQG